MTERLSLARASRSGRPSSNLSVGLAPASSPSRGASGETVHFAGTAKASPTRSNGDDRRQWRKQGGAVGAAASRMQATAKQTLGAATRPWRAKRLRGQARHERTAHAAIGILFVRAILSLRPQIIVSILALSVTFGDTSPRGRGFVRTGKVCKKLQKPLANFPEMRYNTSRGKSAEN